MSLSATVLDAAYGKLEAFGPDRSLPQAERLRKLFPKLRPSERTEVLKQVALVSATVSSLAHRGGEEKMSRDDIIAELQRAHPFLRGDGLSQALFLVNYNAWHDGHR
jgi:hypothetical protein